MIAVVGINYNTATIEVREGFSFTPSEIIDFLKFVRSQDSITGGIVLSTCNRMEVIFETSKSIEDAVQEVTKNLIKYKKQSPASSKYFFHLAGDRAILHVFSMASGLKSMVRGETQILGQLKEAVTLSRSADLLTPILMRMFDKTYEVAKKVRSSFSLSHAQTSAGAAAVNLLWNKYGEQLKQGESLVLGAGQMADTVVRSLIKYGISNIKTFNRTQDRAIRFANKFNIENYFYGDTLNEAINNSKWIWVATGASSPIINRAVLENSILPDHLIIFDIAVPRNVDVDVLHLGQVRLFGIDDLREGEPDEVDKRFPSSEKVKGLFDEALEEFKLWKEGLALRDVYSAIHEEINLHLTKEIGYIADLDDQDMQKLITKHCSHLATSISTSLISKLRKVSESTRDPIYADIFRKVLMS